MYLMHSFYSRLVTMHFDSIPYSFESIVHFVKLLNCWTLLIVLKSTQSLCSSFNIVHDSFILLWVWCPVILHHFQHAVNSTHRGKGYAWCGARTFKTIWNVSKWIESLQDWIERTNCSTLQVIWDLVILLMYIVFTQWSSRQHVCVEITTSISVLNQLSPNLYIPCGDLLNIDYMHSKASKLRCVQLNPSSRKAKQSGQTLVVHTKHNWHSIHRFRSSSPQFTSLNLQVKRTKLQCFEYTIHFNSKRSMRETTKTVVCNDVHISASTMLHVTKCEFWSDVTWCRKLCERQ